jgi:hypothetical protein
MNDPFDAEVTYQLFRSDLHTLFKLVVTHNQPCSEGDIRAASAILRRWLIEGLLGRMCNALGIKPTFWLLDNHEVIEAINRDPTIVFFLTGGVMFDGRPVMCLYESTADAGPLPKLPIQGGLGQHEVSLADMLAQKRISHNGNFFSCAEIITFTANKLGGVHLNFRRDQKLERLEAASNYMSFGGPIEKVSGKPLGELYFDLEPNGTEVLSGFHIEIIAAAASLLSVHFDGEQLVQITQKQSFRNRIRQALRVPPRLKAKMYDMKNGDYKL